MNHLAHFYLAVKCVSPHNEELIVGNFIADFIKNKDLKDFSPEVVSGVMFHRQIDNFTDNHPVVKMSTKRLHPFHHKYSPVIVDVFYDFLLAKNWDRYSGNQFSLEEFTRYVYNILERNMAVMPTSLKERLPHMISNDWLMGYTSYEGLEHSFKLMERLVHFPASLDTATRHLIEFLDDFDGEFNIFFPDLINAARLL